MKKVEIYTDGACSGNPGAGGWGALLMFNGKTKKISGYEPLTTNNRMELLAVIQALKLLKYPCDVIVYSDSIYVIKGMQSWIFSWQKNNWMTSGNKALKNADLWQELWGLSRKHKVDWQWIKGHDGNPGNEEADRLAREAIEKGD